MNKILGPKRAAQLVYAGQRLDASAAQAAGLVNEIHPRERLMPRAMELANSIMAQPRISRRLAHAMIQQDWRRLISTELRGSYAHQLFGTLSL